mgnify:CR=1 FL=1
MKSCEARSSYHSFSGITNKRASTGLYASPLHHRGIYTNNKQFSLKTLETERNYDIKSP